jgi:hypothetical protein
MSALHRLTPTHAILSTVAWVVLFPLGAIFLRHFKRWHPVKTHIALQTLGLVCYIVGATLGTISTLRRQDWLRFDVHILLGTAVTLLLPIQWALGWRNHRVYKRRCDDARSRGLATPTGRTALGRIHLWLGRILVIGAIINGGLGK